MPAAQERRWKAIIALLAERFGPVSSRRRKRSCSRRAGRLPSSTPGTQTLGFTPDSHFDPVKLFDKDAIARICTFTQLLPNWLDSRAYSFRTLCTAGPSRIAAAAEDEHAGKKRKVEARALDTSCGVVHADEFSERIRADRVNPMDVAKRVAVETLWAKNAVPRSGAMRARPGRGWQPSPLATTALAANPRPPAVVPVSATATTGRRRRWSANLEEARSSESRRRPSASLSAIWAMRERRRTRSTKSGTSVRRSWSNDSK